MLKELDCVCLTADLPDQGLRRDARGAIVHVYASGAAYEVEFVEPSGQTSALVTLRPDQIRPSEADNPRDAGRHRAVS